MGRKSTRKFFKQNPSIHAENNRTRKFRSQKTRLGSNPKFGISKPKSRLINLSAKIELFPRTRVSHFLPSATHNLFPALQLRVQLPAALPHARTSKLSSYRHQTPLYAAEVLQKCLGASTGETSMESTTNLRSRSKAIVEVAMLYV
jgi:hypothetical protein